jgi:hypothetical protein
MANVTKFGGKVVVTLADLADVSSFVNFCGPSDSANRGVVEMFSKFEGCEVLVDTGTGYAIAISTGNYPASPWLILDGTSAPATPA